ncbi:MAG TPA: hypothetical protein PKH93_05465, partial [Chitinophagales bacterium]|nr:hypothetical protein [Chitinophagales bacterium]
CMNTYVIRKLVINKAYTKVEFRDYFCNERKCYLLFLTQKPVFVDGYYFDCLVNNFNLKKFPFVKGIDKNVYVFCKEE